MIRLLAVSTALLLAACQPGTQASASNPTNAVQAKADPVWTALENKYPGINVRPADPVAALEWTEVRCNFLGGEISGKNTAQDRAIKARIDELGCGDIMLAEARAVRTRSSADADAVARMGALLARSES